MTPAMYNACERGLRVAADWRAKIDYLRKLAGLDESKKQMVDELEAKIDHTALLCEVGREAAKPGG